MYRDRKIHLTNEQTAAFEKLKAGILAVAALDAPDHDSLESWLTGGPFRGPSRATVADELVFEAVAEVMVAIRGFDDRDGFESTWEEMVATSLESS